jgi:hypothetical protein
MAIIHEFEQRSEAWYAARLGIPTASEFHRIITAVKGDLSKSASKYAHALLAEKLLRRPLDKPPSTPWAMARGRQLEPFALAQYAREMGLDVRQVGFVTTDDGRLGASPDGLIVGEPGGAEFKCLLDDNHVSLWADGPGEDFRQQVQGNLAIAELEWWDLYGYHPNLPAVRIRTYRDEPYIAKMGVALVQFLEIRDELVAKAEQAGWEAHAAEPLPATFAAVRAAA